MADNVVTITDTLAVMEGLTAYALFLPSEYTTPTYVRLARTTHGSLLERLLACKADIANAIVKRKKGKYIL